MQTLKAELKLIVPTGTGSAEFRITSYLGETLFGKLDGVEKEKAAGLLQGFAVVEEGTTVMFGELREPNVNGEDFVVTFERGGGV